MRRILLLAGCMMLITGGTLAQGGFLHVWGDSARCVCDPDNTAGFMFVHVIHEGSPGATACQFAVQINGVPLTWVGDYSYFTSVIGNTQSGIAVAYGECMVSPIHVVRMTYLGVSNPCDMIRIVADPTTVPPGIYATDCATPVPNLLVIGGGTTYINTDGTCWNCSPYYDPPWCTVPVEKTTWGKVKEIYR